MIDELEIEERVDAIVQRIAATRLEAIDQTLHNDLTRNLAEANKRLEANYHHLSRVMMERMEAMERNFMQRIDELSQTVTEMERSVMEGVSKQEMEMAVEIPKMVDRSQRAWERAVELSIGNIGKDLDARLGRVEARIKAAEQVKLDHSSSSEVESTATGSEKSTTEKNELVLDVGGRIFKTYRYS